MKMRYLILAAVCFCLLLAGPATVYAVDNPWYINLKAGVFVPTGNLDDDEWDSGGSAELALGHRFAEQAALELAVGGYRADFDDSGADLELTVIPVTLSILGIYSQNTTHVYLGAGAGYYFAEIDADVDVGSVNISDKDNDAVFGYHVVIGVDVDITPEFLIGVEARHVWTNEADFRFKDSGNSADYESELNGAIYYGKVGFRF